MAAIDEARLQLQTAIANWDFSPAFPSGYVGNKAVVVVDDFPMDLDTNLQSEANGMLLIPIISVVPLPASEVEPTLGDFAVNQAGAPGGKTRYARTVYASFVVACWADLQTGGGEMAEALGGQVRGCVFVNKNALTSYRRLKTSGGHLLFDEPGQFWSYQLSVEGCLVESFDQ